MIQTAKISSNLVTPASGVRHGATKVSLTQCRAIRPEQQGYVVILGIIYSVIIRSGQWSTHSR